MSERVAKVESLVQQVVAGSLRSELGPESARVTVTRVDVSPDLRHAIVWLGVIGNSEKHSEELYESAIAQLKSVQRVLAQKITTKFVPRLTFKLDTGGQHAQEIGRVFRNL